LAQEAGIELEDNGYITVTGTNGAGVSTSKPGIFVAGCASGPKNIKDSITDAHSAASCALAQLDPRLLDSESASKEEEQKPKTAAQISPDDMRSQIEQLLYALINRPDS
jgi:heterodisulfide reductase subunit A-like polyferredoxin